MTSSPGPYRVPPDMVGSRLPGEQPLGPLGILLAAGRTIRARFGRLLVIMACMLAVYVVLAAVLVHVVAPVQFLSGDGHLLEKGERFLMPITWPVYVPLAAGVAWAFLLVAQGFPARTVEIFRSLQSLPRYLNVLAAGAVPVAIQWLLALAVHPLADSWDWMPPADERSFASAFLRTLPGIACLVVALPLAFAALHVIVARTSFHEALERNLKMVWRNPALFAGFVALSLVFTVTESALQAGFRAYDSFAQAWLGSYASELAIHFATAFVIILAYLLDPLVAVLFYREMVWRDREAAVIS